MSKLTLLAAAGVGYVLGAKAGHQRYEQIVGTFHKVKDNPKVQEKAQQATHLAKEKAPVVKDKVAGAAGAATTKVIRDRRRGRHGRPSQPGPPQGSRQHRPPGHASLIRRGQ